MTAMISRPPLGDRLTSSKVIAVLRASHVSALAPLTLSGRPPGGLELTPSGMFDALEELANRYAGNADVGVGTILTSQRPDGP